MGLRQLVQRVMNAKPTVVAPQMYKPSSTGGAGVTIEVDGRQLLVPRCILMNLLTAASNRAAEKLAAVEKTPIGKLRGDALENLLEERRYYEQDALVPATQILDFLRSDQ